MLVPGLENTENTERIPKYRKYRENAKIQKIQRKCLNTVQILKYRVIKSSVTLKNVFWVVEISAG